MKWNNQKRFIKFMCQLFDVEVSARGLPGKINEILLKRTNWEANAHRSCNHWQMCDTMINGILLRGLMLELRINIHVYEFKTRNVNRVEFCVWNLRYSVDMTFRKIKMYRGEMFSSSIFIYAAKKYNTFYEEMMLGECWCTMRLAVRLIFGLQYYFSSRIIVSCFR